MGGDGGADDRFKSQQYHINGCSRAVQLASPGTKEKIKNRTIDDVTPSLPDGLPSSRRVRYCATLVPL